MQYLYKLSFDGAEVHGTQRAGGRGWGGGSEEEERKYICIGIHESNWCVCVGGGGEWVGGWRSHGFEDDV